MGKVAPRELEDGLRNLYDGVTREPIPPAMADLIGKLGEVEPGAMGGNAPGSVPIAGGELARA